MSGFEPDSRARNLGRLADETYDVLVIGGGITGAGVAREAALRGLRTALVEARDFASGTSSRSSKLIHGGLRYLEQGEVALVREAATERKSLRRIAPHRTAVAPMLLPVHGRTSAGLYKLRVGLALYEKLAAVADEELHRVLGRAEAMDVEPHLAPDRLQGAVLYPEYQTDDARLVLDTVKSAHAADAVVVNYARVTGLRPGRPQVVAVHDVEGDGTVEIRARAIVNAGGPWVDGIRSLAHGAELPSLHLTKGIHVVFRSEDLPARHCVVMRARDGRPVFVVPRGQNVYVGTTDTDYEGPLDEPAISAEDVVYLLDALARTFRNVLATPERVVGAWAGLRPLVREPGKKPSEISRKDEIVVSGSGMVTIAGGKLTAYRKMAERVVDTVASLLDVALPRSPSAEQALPGGDLGGSSTLDAYAASPAVRDALAGVSGDTQARLIATHGSDAPAVVRETGGAESFTPLMPDVPLSAGEVRYALRREMARTLSDLLERRSRLAFFATESARRVAPSVAAIAARALGWDDGRTRRELESFERRCDARLAWQPDRHPREERP